MKLVKWFFIIEKYEFEFWYFVGFFLSSAVFWNENHLLLLSEKTHIITLYGLLAAWVLVSRISHIRENYPDSTSKHWCPKSCFSDGRGSFNFCRFMLWFSLSNSKIFVSAKTCWWELKIIEFALVIARKTSAI